MHDQSAYRVRSEWGPTGAAAVAADVCVVVDVLSFTTTVSIAVGRGITVLPYRWRDARAASYAASRSATLAVGRLEARASTGPAVSLSPAAMASVEGVSRLVLPSPNGSSIAFALSSTGAEVVAGCLRNRSVVAAHLRSRLASGASVAVVAAGERWPDETLRPCAEDLWGAGAVLSLLPGDLLSPEARLAARAYDAVAADLARELLDTSGGRELADRGFADDVTVAARTDADDVVPVLRDGAFRAL